MATADTDIVGLRKFLKKLRDNPPPSEEVSDALLRSVFVQLERVSKNGSIHWFCEHATELTLDAATFLLRLYAYDGPQVIQWKYWLNECLSACCGCVLGLEKVKESSKSTFFSIFSDDVTDTFWTTFSKWEIESVLEQLSSSGVTLDSSDDTKHLSDVPTAVVYRMICNLRVFQDPRIQAIIYQFSSSQLLPKWPADPFLPGMLILMMHENNTVRDWAANQASKCTCVPIPEDSDLRTAYEVATETIIRPLISNPLKVDKSRSIETIPLISERITLWTSLYSILRLIHPKFLTFVTSQGVDIRHVITGHMHDHGPEFETILRCFNLILKRLGKDLWNGEGPEYPQVVFDAFKDNPSLTDLLNKKDLSAERTPWFFNWLPEFLLTIRDHSVYPEILAKMADFMCEELQHERFGDARPVVMASAARFLKGQFKVGDNPAVTNVLDIHAEALVTISFARSRQGSEWEAARSLTRDLIHQALTRDLSNIVDAITRSCSVLARAARKTLPQEQNQGIAPLLIREQMWRKVYLNLQPNDGDGLATILSIISHAAHLDSILHAPFSRVEKFPGLFPLLDAVNRSLGIVKDGFLDMITRYTNNNVSDALLAMLKRPAVAKDVVKLMLSPVDTIHDATQTLVGFAFDVDSRLDSFRALFEKCSVAALEGSIEFLLAFTNYAPIITEACSLSTSLVRSFNDIIEVLCSGPNGLLLHLDTLSASDKKEVASLLPQLWTSMCKAIAVIFKRTPAWAQFYRNEEMIVWMRDALIFGRDLLNQRRVFAAAFRSSGDNATSSRSAISKKMANDLQDILVELMRWLRLTDEELLHQSCALLRSLLEYFRETGNPPSEEARKKLAKQIADAHKRDPNSLSSRLDLTRLDELEDVLASFDTSKDDADDDVEIISYKKAAPPDKAAERTAQSSIKPEPSSKVKDTTVKSSGKTSSRASSSSAAPSRSKNSPFFSSADQELLDSTTSMPKYRKAVASDKAPGPAKGASLKEAKAEPSDSSSSDESADEESQRSGLANLAKLQKSPKIRKPAERRQVQMLDLPRMAKNPQEARINRAKEARRVAQRLKPDISGLHRTLLTWDYNFDGVAPPKAKLRMVHVPDRFSDFAHYKAVFEPLLLMECWAQLLQSKDETPDSYGCRIVSRQYDGAWSDLELSLDGDVRRDWYLTESDVVLLRHSDGKTTILAKGIGSKHVNRESMEATVRCYLAPGSADPGLQLNSHWQISKVFSLSTLHREYAALVSAEYYDFAEMILQPRLEDLPKLDPKDIRQAIERYKVNEPQARAIVSSLRTEGFSLIQGPPGTGKTSTICALISATLPTRLHVPAQSGNDKTPTPKILLCAPSNAAIDEIVHRLKTGSRSLNVVRIGANNSIGLNVKDVSLDFLIDQKLGSDSQKPGDLGNEMTALRQLIESTKQLRQEKILEVQELHDNSARYTALQDEINRLNSKRASLMKQFDQLKDKQQSQQRTMDTARRRARLEVLQEADVICSTLSGAGHESLESFTFEMVIIDEAAQAIELSSLIPLKYSCKRCVMVGDPQQLPPTVLSREATKFHYNQSLFVRLQKQRPDAVHLLSIQYRMHPEISRLPSHLFYEGRLKDGAGMDVKTKQPWQSHPKFGIYRFLNVSRGLEESSGRSTKNKYECQVAVALYNRLKMDFSSLDLSLRVGVVSMYRAQIVELKKAFEQRFGRDILGEVDFNTVDGFQGQEKDVIILSCVRAGPGVTSVGFLTDIRRMNVALTRAKSSLFILGHVSTLERSDETWRKIVADARERNLLTDVDVSFYMSPSAAANSTNTSNKVVSRPKSKLVKASDAVPPDLSTPKELKAAMSNASVKPSITVPVQPPQLDIAPPVSDTQNHKRKRDTSVPDAVPQQSSTNKIANTTNSSKSDTGPLPKRPKPPQTMFIPKKNKRPAEDNAGPGPSSTRRRL